MAQPKLTSEERGKTVVNAEGDKLGMVTDVSGESMSVKPSPGIADTIRTKLGWGEADDEDYVLNESQIAEITDDEIRLK